MSVMLVLEQENKNDNYWVCHLILLNAKYWRLFHFQCFFSSEYLNLFFHMRNKPVVVGSTLQPHPLVLGNASWLHSVKEECSILLNSVIFLIRSFILNFSAVFCAGKGPWSFWFVAVTDMSPAWPCWGTSGPRFILIWTGLLGGFLKLSGWWHPQTLLKQKPQKCWLMNGISTLTCFNLF